MLYVRPSLIALACFALFTQVFPFAWLLSPVSFIMLALLVLLSRPSGLVSKQPDIVTDLLLLLGACLTSAPAFGIEPLLIAVIPLGVATWWSHQVHWAWKKAIPAFLLSLLLVTVVWRPLTLGVATLSRAPLLFAAILIILAWRWEQFINGIRVWLGLFHSRKTVFLGVAGGVALFLGAVGTWRAFAAIIPSSPFIPWALSAAGLLVLLWVPTYLWRAIMLIRQDASRLPDWPAWVTGLIMALALTATLSPVVVFGVAGAHATQGVAWSDLLPGAIVGVALLIAGMVHDHLRKMLMTLPFLSGILALGAGLSFAFVEVFLSMDAPGTILAGMLACGVLVTGFVVFLYEIWRD